MNHGPPGSLIAVSVNKKERMKHLRQLKKQAQEEEQDRRRQQEVKQSTMKEDLEKHVKSMQRGSSRATNKQVSGGGGRKVAVAKTEILRVKRHSIEEDTVTCRRMLGDRRLK